MLIWISVLPLTLHAEHVFEFGLRAGMAGWNSQPVYLNKRVGLHAGGQFYYTYYSPYVIGFRTGVTLDRHQMAFVRTDYTDTYSTIDVENQQMVIDYRISQLTERYTGYSVGVPLQLAFSRNRFTFLAGPKVVCPFHNKWYQTAQNAELSVYYPAYDNRVYESVPLAASRDFTQTKQHSHNKPVLQWWVALELNYAIPVNTWSRNHRSYMMVGLYFDYCFSKSTPTPSEAESLLMLTDTRDGFPLQRIMTFAHEANRQGRQLVPDYTPYDLGIKISYAISPYNPHRASGKHCNCL